ncbi:MAG: hypothetical protein JXA99_05820 [Candidatus Lokiarchaeota archaeon]|nr:hypothetical protein [Candidatus Lokiarchaeota archaeon]
MDTSIGNMGVEFHWLTIHELSDVKMKFSVDFYIKSKISIFPPILELYQVIAFEIWFESTSSSGNWPELTKVFEVATGILGDQNPTDDDHWFYSCGPYEFYETGVVEYGVIIELRILYDYNGIRGYTPHRTTPTGIGDDDSTGPDYHGEFYDPNLGWKDIVAPIDMTSIPKDQYGGYRIRINIHDPSQISECKSHNSNNWVPINLVQGHTKLDDYNWRAEWSILELYNFAKQSGVDFDSIQVWMDYKDNDNDRGVIDRSFSSISYQIDIYETPSYENSVKVFFKPFETQKGISMTVEGLSTTLITRYKKDNMRNEVTVSLDLENNERYPIRMEFAITMYAIQNALYNVITEDFYEYEYNPNYKYYEGGITSDAHLRDFFQYDSEFNLENYDNDISFWIELGEKNTVTSKKTIDLFTFSIDNMKLIDEEQLFSEDIEDLGFGLFEIIPDVYGIMSAIKDLIEDVSEHVKEVEEFMEQGSLKSDLINWYNLWKQYQGIPGVLNPGGSVFFDIMVQQAFVAYKSSTNPNDNTWTWRIDYIDDDDDCHYTRENDNERQKLDSMVCYSDYFQDVPNKPGLKYCGIGFIPGLDQQAAFASIILAEVLSDLCYLGASLVNSKLMDPKKAVLKILISSVLFIAGGLIDFTKNGLLLKIANGEDTPYLVSELISFPYEKFTELFNGLNLNIPIAIKGKEFIETMLKYDENGARMFVNMEELKSSYLEGIYNIAKEKSEVINEISKTGLQLSKQMSENFISLVEEINIITEYDILSFNQEDLNLIRTYDFKIDPNFIDFAEYYIQMRGLNDTIIRDLHQTETTINNINIADLNTLNNAIAESMSTFDMMKRISSAIIESNSHTKVHISEDLLDGTPLNDQNTILKIEELNNRLDNQAKCVLNESYFESIKIGEEIQFEALQLYQETFREEFMTLYKLSYNMMSGAKKANQIEMTLIDTPSKITHIGETISFDFTLLNLPYNEFINRQENVTIEFALDNLPSELEFKILQNDIELDKNNEGYYFHRFTGHETKIFTIELIISQSNNIESNIYNLVLKASGDGILKKYYEIEFDLSINDDDVNPPDISYEYIGDYTDSNSGYIIVAAFDLSGLSLDPSGTYLVTNELGTYEFTFIAIDNDNESSEDALTTIKMVNITIIDDDILAPQITNLVITYRFEDVLISFDAYDEVSGDDSGLSLIKIYIDQILVLTEVPIGDQTSYEFIILNQWGDDLGNHDVKIEVWDNDNDREQDSLMKEEFGSFEAIEKPPANGIPGYDLVLIFAVIGFTCIFLLTRKRRLIRI